jgi:transposase-like protein
MTDHNNQSLRRRLAAHDEQQAGEARRRFPAELKAEVVAVARKRRQAGLTLRALGDELGLRAETVRRWIHVAKKARTGKAVRVKVVADTRSSNGGVVVTPAGNRVEGLTVREIAALLRELT